MVQACRRLCEEAAAGEIKADAIDEELLSSRLLTAGLPDPEVLICTSGALRISNFLYFQFAYTELFFLQKQWNELTRDDFGGVIAGYSQRCRRFGT